MFVIQKTIVFFYQTFLLLHFHFKIKERETKQKTRTKTNNASVLLNETHE